MLVAFGMMAQAQNFNREYKLLYTDTNILAGGDTIVRSVYGLLPLNDMIDSTITFNYQRIYEITGLEPILKNEKNVGHYNDTVVIGGTTYTFKQAYDLIIAINETNWQAGSWQVFLQYINN